MMKSEPKLVVTVSHTFSATAERVFDAWLDPVLARQFLFATPTGAIIMRGQAGATVACLFQPACNIRKTPDENVHLWPVGRF